MVLLLYLGLAPLITSKSRIPRWKPLMLPSRYPSPYIPNQFSLLAYSFPRRIPIRYTGFGAFSRFRPPLFPKFSSST